jgi:hypothetical protein
MPRTGQGRVTLAVTCSPEDEADAELWREDQDEVGAMDTADDGSSSEPALFEQSTEVC